MARTTVILMENLGKLGPKYAIKSVASGFARNFLIPRGQAILATDQELARLKELKAKAKKTKLLKYNLFEQTISQFKDLTLNLSGQANEKGHLYGAIHAEEITEALKKDWGLDIDPTWLILKEPIKNIGEYLVKIIPNIDLKLVDKFDKSAGQTEKKESEKLITDLKIVVSATPN